jgi:hypothetical protein
MDLQIYIENENTILTSGDVISGKVHVFCAQPTTISKFTTNLIGESTSSLTGAPGLLFSRREEEKHTFVSEEYQIIPSFRSSTFEKAEPIRLGVGCHSFDFKLRVPWFEECRSCPSSSSIEEYDDHDSVWKGSRENQQLPPSIRDLQKGTDITYRVEVAVTTIRNMFKSRTIKVRPPVTSR